MLDEEVLLKTSRNSGETMAMFSAVAAVCLTALLFGGDSDLGVGALIALGILAPISLYHGALNWQTARRGAVWKFPVLLLPNLAALAIAAVGICRPVVEMVWIGETEWARLADNPQWTVVSGALNPVYPITSELAALSAAACGLSLYFVATSKFVLRKIFVYCSIPAFLLAVLGFALAAASEIAGNDEIGFGPGGFSLFPNAASWCAYAILWQGGALAAAVYSAQRFSLLPALCSWRFLGLACSLTLLASAVFRGAPVEAALLSVVEAAGIFALAADSAPTKSNLGKYRISRVRGGISVKVREWIPFSVYAALGAAVLFFAVGKCGECAGLYFSPSAQDAPAARQAAALDADARAMSSERPVFGWGEASFPTVFAYFQGSDLGPVPRQSPKSDLERCVIENGYAGLALALATPALFLCAFLARRRISLSSAVLGISAASAAFLACVRTPFESVAVMASFSVLMYAFFGWDSSEG